MSGEANLDGERLPSKHLYGNLGILRHETQEKFLNFKSFENIFYSYR